MSPPGGIVCPRCGCGHFRVVYTRPRPALVATRDAAGRQVVRPAEGGSIVRRRQCRRCGHRITTVERASDGD